MRHAASLLGGDLLKQVIPQVSSTENLPSNASGVAFGAESYHNGRERHVCHIAPLLGDDETCWLFQVSPAEPAFKCVGHEVDFGDIT